MIGGKQRGFSGCEQTGTKNETMLEKFLATLEEVVPWDAPLPFALIEPRRPLSASSAGESPGGAHAPAQTFSPSPGGSPAHGSVTVEAALVAARRPATAATAPTGLCHGRSPQALRVATGRRRAGYSSRQRPHTVPSQPRAVQCSRP